MAITSLAQLSSAARQRLKWLKTASPTTVANIWFTLINQAGLPAAGVLTMAGSGSVAGGNPGVGQVPDDTGTLAGFLPMFNTFGSNTGYLARVEAYSSVACRLMLYDRLYQCGSYAYNMSSQAMSGQPSFTSRLPSGPDYTDCELWAETSTAFVTAAPTITVAYNNQAGSGNTTSVVPGGLTVSRMTQMPLIAGDSGVSLITNVSTTVGSATAGAFNVLVIRPLLSLRIAVATSSAIIAGPDLTGVMQIFQHSAFQVASAPDSTGSGVVEVYMEIANG